jgi:1-phosphatidylinositol phosphodiesterase
VSLPAQLNAGIRVLDIRARHKDNSFPIHHGFVFQNAWFDSGVMRPVIAFLRSHPSETVLIRLSEEYEPENTSRSFADTFLAYMSSYDSDLQTTYGNYVWRPNGATNPTLQEVRGKIVFMLQPGKFDGSTLRSWGIPYGDGAVMSIQDNYNLGTNWDLYGKWESVRNHLNAATAGSRSLIYINYLSGSGGSFPYFVASGHSSPGTGAPRLPPGLTTPGWSGSYPDFPRVDCFIGICTIAFEGTNTLTKDYLLSGRVGLSGIVMADFPGEGLINAIISRNAFNLITIKSAFNGKCLDVEPGTSNIHMWDCHNGTNQQWTYDRATGAIHSLFNDLCLDSPGSYGRAYMSWCHYGANQQWDLLPSGEIRERARGQCLDIYEWINSNGAQVVMYHCSGNANQRWTSTTDLGVVRSDLNSKCLDVNPSTRDVYMWDCHGGSNQQWTYDHATGVIRSRFLDNNQCLDAATAYGNAYMHECHYGANQQWDLLPSGQIRERAWGQCLDIYERRTENGADVTVYTCHTGPNQHWAPNR